MDGVPPSHQSGSPEPSAPSGIERRMVLRLLTYWRKIAMDDRMPLLANLAPEDIPEMWPHCYLLDCAAGDGDPTFRSIGPELAYFWKSDLVGCRVSEIPEGTLVREAVSYISEVFAKRVPISRGGRFTQYDGAQILYRSILLPISSDGREMDTILGAANCRIVVEA